MHRKRVSHLSEALQAKNCEIAFLTNPVHIFYYTNFLSDPHERFFAYVYDRKEDKGYLFLPTLDVEEAKDVAKVDEIIPVADTENGYQKMQDSLARPLSTLAIEKEKMTLAELERLQAVFPHINYVSLDTFIHEARLFKEEGEVDRTRKAIAITEEGLRQILPQIRPGMTEIDIKQKLEATLFSLGAEDIAFDTLVLTGRKSSLPHGTSGKAKVQEGDFLLFDFGVTYQGYHSDMTRTFVVGEPSREQKEIYETVKKANEAAIDAVKVGLPLQRIDLAARRVIEEAGYGDYFTHRVGHGLGMEVHEAPSIHSENEALLKPGMLFTIEPGIYIPTIGGVRIEDDIYVNEAGEVEVLTSFSKELQSL